MLYDLIVVVVCLLVVGWLLFFLLSLSPISLCIWHKMCAILLILLLLLLLLFVIYTRHAHNTMWIRRF